MKKLFIGFMIMIVLLPGVLSLKGEGSSILRMFTSKPHISYDSNNFNKLAQDSRSASSKLKNSASSLAQVIDQEDVPKSDTQISDIEANINKTIRSYTEQSQILQEDLSVCQTTINEVYEQAIARSDKIRDLELREQQIKLLKKTKQQLQEAIQQTQVSISKLAQAAEGTKDLVIVAANNKSIKQMKQAAQEINNLSSTAQNLMSKLENFSQNADNQLALDATHTNVQS